MRIVFIAARDLGKIGGIETYMKHLCTKLVEKGHTTILYCEGDKFSKFTTKEGVNIITFKSLKSKFINKLYIGFIATLHSLLFNKKVDIYHYNAFATALFSWLPRLCFEKVIFQGHGFEWQRTKWSEKQRKIIKSLEIFALLINKNITMVSDEQTEFVNANFNKKALTITSAINIPNPNSYTSNVLSRFGLIQNKYILFLGRLVQEKNPDLLIKAFKRSNLQDLKLVIAGYDDRAKKYIDSLVQMGLNNKNVIFTGAVYGDDKEVLLRDCHSFCIPSSLEGLPITLLEAMSYSKLCIASNIPACKEAMGSTGLYFKDKDIENLISVLNSLEQSDIILERNDAFVRVKSKFTWDIVSKQYEQFCKSIVGNF